MSSTLLGHLQRAVKIQHILVGSITYAVFLVISLFVAAVLWSCIAPDEFYHCYYDAPLITFVPPFQRPWADPTHGRLPDYFLVSPWIVYPIWFVFFAAAIVLPAVAVWLLRRQGKLRVRWFVNPQFIISFVAATAIIYILSLGPLLCSLSLGTEWDGWPRWIQRLYVPLHPWITRDFDTAYGQYLLWWVNFQYRGHW
jgi:hypothetical protein